MILEIEEMSQVEENAFSRGVTAEDLMEKVGRRMAGAIAQNHPEPGFCLVYCGKGNNGGDALVAARYLRERGWQVQVRLAFAADQLGELPRRKLRELNCPDNARQEPPALGQETARPLVILDGLLGLGARGPLRAPLDEICAELNRLRKTHGATVYAMDLPTGLDGQFGEPAEHTVVADYTLTVTFVKTGLLADAAINHVGRLMVIPVEELEEQFQRDQQAKPSLGKDRRELLTPRTLYGFLPYRPFESHKGLFGRIGVVAGSRGFTGAAQMTTLAALRAGGGLVTLFALEDVYPILASCCAPEVMVRPVRNWGCVFDEKLDVLALGPGIGGDLDDERRGAILRLIREWPGPMVIDADGLNILSNEMEALRHAAGPRLLTPHPGEMKRLDPDMPEDRRRAVEGFIQKYSATLVLKGSRTIIGERGQALRYNSTGNPGMATGGMGDVLTGTIAALLGAGLSRRDAASVAVWLCGRAAEIALFHAKESPESLLPLDVLKHFGQAFSDLRRQVY